MTNSEKNFQVVMPKLGLTMTEATIVEWHKNDGDAVQKGETLFTLETEKTVLDIESPASGVLHILVQAGENVPVQTPVATLGNAQGIVGTASSTAVSLQDAIPIASPKARATARERGVSLEGIIGTGVRGMIVASDIPSQVADAQGTIPITSTQDAIPIASIKASPVARKMAEETDLDLRTIAGTGPGGRIMREDVESALAAPTAPPISSIENLTGLRGIIAERLSQSWRERPHVTITTEAEATNLISARQQVIAELDEKVSYNAFLVMLVARALREHPNINVRLTAAGIEEVPHINIGVAVDSERGLLVPVIRDAPAKNLTRVQRELLELIDRALAGRSLPDDLTGGTFTITNLGVYGIDAFTPIINPPESAILGIGRIAAKPVVVDGQVVARQMMTLSLSFDHRLIDGAPAARFLQRVKQLIERPFALAFL